MPTSTVLGDAGSNESDGAAPAAREPPKVRNRALVTLGFVAIALAAIAGTVFTTHYAYPHGTNDLDEVAYQAQANALRAGHLSLPAAKYDPFFRPYLSGVHDGRVVFKYQPVWPAMIAASDGLFGSSAPLRILMSIAGALSVAWLGWELTRDHRVALIAGFLVTLSPFVWVQTASLLGYQLSFVAATAAGAALLRVVRTRRLTDGILAGVLTGLAVMHRPFDAVLAIGPLVAYALWQAWRSGAFGHVLTAVAIGGAPFAVMFAAYNQTLMGSPLTMPFNVSGGLDKFGFGWRSSFEVPNGSTGGQIHYTLNQALHTTQHVIYILPRFIALFPAVASCLAIAIWMRRRDGRLWLLVAMIGSVVVGYFFWWGNANVFHFGLERGLGPFYEYPLLAPVLVGAAWGFVSLRSGRAKIAILVAGIAWAGFASVTVLRDARTSGDIKTAEVATISAPGHAIVLEAPLFPNDPYLRYANDGEIGGKRIVAVDQPGRQLDVIDRFPTYTPYSLRRSRTLDDPFGAVHEARIPLTVTNARAITAVLHATTKDNRAATSYLRVGDSAPLFGPTGSAAVDASWRITPQTLSVPPNRITVLAVGITVAKPGQPAPAALTDEWYECRFEARATASGGIEALSPCDGWHHYRFPGGATLTSLEDLSPVLQVLINGA